MKVTYKKIAEIHDVFKKLSEMEVSVLNAGIILQGVLELDARYGEIDRYKNELINIHTVALDSNGKFEFKDEEHEKQFNEEYNNFLNQKIQLENFPLTLSGNEIKVSAIDLLRIGSLIHFN